MPQTNLVIDVFMYGSIVSICICVIVVLSCIFDGNE
jgi:hypothetical protein